MKDVEVVVGDLLDQPVEGIVNSWNRNFIPWWLLWPQGVSGAIRRRAGTAPFREVSRHGLLAPGAAVVTSAGRLPFRAIIHVAGLNWWWTASESTVRASTRNALAAALEAGLASLAFPLIGAGTGGLTPARVEAWMLEELAASPARPEKVLVVRFGVPLRANKKEPGAPSSFSQPSTPG